MVNGFLELQLSVDIFVTLSGDHLMELVSPEVECRGTETKQE